MHWSKTIKEIYKEEVYSPGLKSPKIEPISQMPLISILFFNMLVHIEKIQENPELGKHSLVIKL